MSTFKRYEDIEAWKKCRAISGEINQVTKYPNFRDDPDLKRQLKRSAGSAMDNIAEGFEGGGKNEFIQFLSISKGSIGETRSQLYRALDQDFISHDQFQQTSNLAVEISKMTEGLMNYLRKSDIKGPKYKR
jgi:four helix bundle protein